MVYKLTKKTGNLNRKLHREVLNPNRVQAFPTFGRARHHSARTQAIKHAETMHKRIPPEFHQIVAANPNITRERLSKFFGINKRLVSNHYSAVLVLKSSGNIRDAARISGLTPETVEEIQKILRKSITAENKRVFKSFAEHCEGIEKERIEKRKKVAEAREKAREAKKKKPAKKKK